MSHVLSSRMSSRPMGWSRTGCEVLSMAQIRASEKNENYDIGKYYDTLQASVENDIIARQFGLRRTIRNSL